MHSCCRTGPLLPLENVSWDELVGPDGFFARLLPSEAGRQLLAQSSLAGGTFRLPSEAEWEYAWRGGPHWCDGKAGVLAGPDGPASGWAS